MQSRKVDALRLCLHLLLAAIGLSLPGRPLVAQLTLEGLELVQEGPVAQMGGDPAPDNLATGAIPFATSELGPEIGTAYHFIDNLNDGFYGNEFSWIGGDDNPFFDTFAGIDFGPAPVPNVQSIAFGRSNVLGGDVCGVCKDRHMGFYILQYTQIANPSSDLDIDTTGNPVTGWVDVGTLEYGASDGPDTLYNDTWVRHRYNFSPVDATGIRLIVPGTGLGGGTAIDEIELYDVAGELVPPPPPPPPILIAPADGFTISWDGNEADHFDELEPPDGSIVPDNAALASNGALPFSSSDLGPQLGIDFHIVDNLNDGFYGNSNSWIGGDDNPFAPEAFAGIQLAEELEITSIAWGRDNGNDFADACGGQCTDRSAGRYELQFTLTDDPDEDTENTGDAATGWQTIGSLTYNTGDEDFTEYLRHEFELAQDGQGIVATGIRILVPRSGLGGGTAIDEIEIYGNPVSLLPCDLNGDSVCDVQDIDLLTAKVLENSNEPEFDLNKDGFVNGADRTTWVVDLMNTWFGDSDLDGDFDSGDLVVVFTAGEYEDDIDGNSGWGEGDWNGDADFSSSDLVVAFTDGGYEAGKRNEVAVVPEPTTGVLCLMALVGLLLRRRLVRE